MTSLWPEGHLIIYAVGNGHYGGNERKLGKMNRMGMQAGVADLCIPARRGCFGGLYLELKSHGGKLRPTQKQFAIDAIVQGYQCEVAHSVQEAIYKICRYLFEYEDRSLPCECHPGKRRMPRDVFPQSAVNWVS